VLMLNFGWQRDWYNRHSEHLRTNELSEQTFGPRIECRPQRAIAIKRFKRLCIASAFAVIIGLAAISLTLLAYLGSAAWHCLRADVLLNLSYSPFHTKRSAHSGGCG